MTSPPCWPRRPQVRETLTAETVQDVLKQVRKLRKAFANLSDIDFFPGEAPNGKTDTALMNWNWPVRGLCPGRAAGMEA